MIAPGDKSESSENKLKIELFENLPNMSNAGSVILIMRSDQ